MKLYISADLEGLACSTHWDETEKNHPDWHFFAKQMTAEVNAAIKGAKRAGATEIIVKDAHDSARNIIPDLLEEEVTLIRGWAADPLCMVTGIDETFDALLYIGYHSAGDDSGNPLSHTLSNHELLSITLNGQVASEFMINTYAAALYGVPAVFVSGDASLMEEVHRIQPNIAYCVTKEGMGGATKNRHPQEVCRAIEQRVYEALKRDVSDCSVKLPTSFQLELHYTNHIRAKRCSFYPGAQWKKPRTVQFQTNDYYEILRALHFLT